MITEDYILKLIRLGAEFIAKALGLSREGNFLESEKTLENGLQDLTGISLDTLMHMDAATLRTMTGGDDASVFILARFLTALAEIERQKGKEDSYYNHLEKSLRLYLDINVTEDIETDKPIMEIYEQVRHIRLEDGTYEKLLAFAKEGGYGDMQAEIEETAAL